MFGSVVNDYSRSSSRTFPSAQYSSSLHSNDSLREGLMVPTPSRAFSPHPVRVTLSSNLLCVGAKINSHNPLQLNGNPCTVLQSTRGKSTRYENMT